MAPTLEHTFGALWVLAVCPDVVVGDRMQAVGRMK